MSNLEKGFKGKRCLERTKDIECVKIDFKLWMTSIKTLGYPLTIQYSRLVIEVNRSSLIRNLYYEKSEVKQSSLLLSVWNKVFKSLGYPLMAQILYILIKSSGYPLTIYLNTIAPCFFVLEHGFEVSQFIGLSSNQLETSICFNRWANL